MILDEILKKSLSGSTRKDAPDTSSIDNILKSSKSGDEDPNFNYPKPIIETPIVPVKKPSLVNRALTSINNLTERPDENTLGTNATKNTLRYVPSAIVENLPFGVGEIIKQSREDPTTVSNVNFEDILQGIIDTSKGTYKGLISAGTSLAGVPLKFNVPGLGEVTNLQYNAAQRINNGESLDKVILEEGVVNNIFGTLMLVGLANEVAGPRPTTIMKTQFKGETPSGITVKNQPKSFRLYEEPIGTQSLKPEFIQKMAAERGVELPSTYDSTLPTYFKMTGTGSGLIKGEVVQVKPSYLETFLNKLGMDINKVPDNMLVPVISKEINPKEITSSKVQVVPENAVIPKPKEDMIAKVENLIPKITSGDEQLVNTVKTMAQETGDQAIITKVDEAITAAEKVSGQVQEQTQKLDQIIQESTNTPEKQLSEPSYVPYTPAKAKPASQVYSKTKIMTGDFNGQPYSTDAFILEFNSNIVPSKKAIVSEGPKEDAIKKIIPALEDLKQVEITKVVSNDNFEYAHLEGDGVYADIDRKYYDYFNKKYSNSVFMVTSPTKPVVVMKGGSNVGLIMPMNVQATKGIKPITIWEKPKAVQETIQSISEKTQKEKVTEAIKKGPKSIKKVSQETKILEPNVRRILGVGAKEGIFERVDKGVYTLSKDGIDTAYIETGNALESLPRLASEGFKADMVFLDIPYNTPAIKGGNRGMNYNLISVEEFEKVLDSVKIIAQKENTPIVHMFSQAPSGMKAMQKYNDVFIKKGFKPVGKGELQKTFKDGKLVTNVRGEVSKPEGILVFTQSGELDKSLGVLNFKLIRPKGYQSEKPAEMLKAIIEMTTNEGDIVLDPFAGSGVTGAEAIKAGRKAYLIEKDASVAETITKPRVKSALESSSNGELGNFASPQGQKTINRIIEKQAETKVSDIQEVPKDFKISQRAKEILEEFGVSINERNLGSKLNGGQLLGVYKSLTEKVRVQALYDITTVTHEAIHAIDAQDNFSEELIKSTGNGAIVRKQLTDIYEDLYPKAKRTHSLDKRIKEGLAVLFENYFYDPASISAKYPDLVNSFIKPTGEYYNPKFTRLIEKMNDLVDDYAKLSPEQKINSRIRTGKEVTESKTGFTWKQRIEFEVFNRFEPLKRYGKMAGVSGTWNDPLVQAFNIMNKNGIVASWVKGKETATLMSDGNFKIEEGTVKDYLNLVKGYEKEFRAYLVARRVVTDNNMLTALKNQVQELDVAGLEEMGLSLEDIADLQNENTTLQNKIEKLESTIKKDDFSLQDASAVVEKYGKQFEEATKGYDIINKRLLNMAVENELIDAKTAETYAKEEGYASFRRYIDEDLTSVGTLKTSSKSKVTSFKERTGSQLDIIDPIYSQITSINEIIGKSMENRMWVQQANLANSNPEIARRFEKEAARPSIDAEGNVTFPQEKDPNVIRIFRKGKREFYRVAPEFQAVVKTLRGKEMDTFAKLLRIPASLFTRLTTSANPLFAVGNLSVDQFSALSQTKTDFKPVVDPGKAFYKYIVGNESLDAYVALGGKQQTIAAYYNLSPEDITHKLTGGETKIEKVSGYIDAALGVLELPSNLSELMTRFPEYDRSIKMGKTMSEAMYNASEVTTPFQLQGNLGGATGNAIIRAIPYFNATIQVLYKFGRASGDNPKRMGSVVAGILTVGLTMAILTHKYATDKQKRLLAEQPTRNLSRYIYVPSPNGEDLIKFRIPEQIGILTGMGYLFTAQHYKGNEARFNDYVDVISSSLPEQVQVWNPGKMAFSWLPQAVKPTLQVFFNKKTFPELAPIVPEYMLTQKPSKQYNAYTSNVARTLGTIFNVSPTKLDFWIKNQFGSVGSTIIMQNIPNNPLDVQEEKYVMAGRSYNRFYDNKALVTQNYQDMKDNPKKYDYNEKYAIARENKVYSAVSDLLADMRKKETSLPENIREGAYQLLLKMDSTENIEDIVPDIYKLKSQVNALK